MSESASPRSTARAFALGAVAMAAVIAAGVVAYRALATRGRHVSVHFDQRHDIEKGADVVLDGGVIGTVEDTDATVEGTTVHVRLFENDGAPLPRAVTFVVVDGEPKSAGKRLEAHVIDPGSPPIEDGDAIRGVDSMIDLAIRRGNEAAGRVLRRAEEGLEAAREELERIDWDALGRDARKRSDEVQRRLEQLAHRSGREFEEGVEALEPMFEDLMKDLERLGRSEDAQRLRKRLEASWDEHVRRGRPPDEDDSRK